MRLVCDRSAILNLPLFPASKYAKAQRAVERSTFAAAPLPVRDHVTRSHPRLPPQLSNASPMARYNWLRLWRIHRHKLASVVLGTRSGSCGTDVIKKKEPLPGPKLALRCRKKPLLGRWGENSPSDVNNEVGKDLRWGGWGGGASLT